MKKHSKETLNFSAFREHPRWYSLSKAERILILITLVVIFILLIKSFGIVVFFVYFAAYVIGVFIKSDVFITKKSAIKFANDNGFDISNNNISSVFPFSLIGSPDKVIKKVCIDGVRNDIPFRLQHIQRQKNLSEGVKSYKDYVVLEITLLNQLPIFIVDAKYNDLPIEENFTEYSKLQLEGDFSEYFTVYSPRSEHVDVMSVLSPNTMITIRNYAKYADFIVAENKIWIITPIEKEIIGQQFEELFNALDDVVPILLHRSKSYRK